MDIENRQFEENTIRAARVNGKTVYAVADVLGALAGQENGKKYWTKRKQRARTAGEDIAEVLTRVRLPGVDGKLRLTDAVTVDALATVADELPAERLAAFMQWHTLTDMPVKKTRTSKKAAKPEVTETPAVEIAEEASPLPGQEPEATAMPEAAEIAPAPARRKRNRGGRKKPAQGVSAQIMEEVLEEMAETTAEAPVDDVPALPTDAEMVEAAPAPNRRKRSRGGRKKNAQAAPPENTMDAVTTSDPDSAPTEIVLGDAAPISTVDADEITPADTEVAEPSPTPTRRKRSRGGRKKNAQAAPSENATDAAPTGDSDSAPTEMTAGDAESISTADADENLSTEMEVAEPAPAPTRRKRSRGGKKKNGTPQAAAFPPAEAEEDKAKDKVQKAVTKAVAKAAAKAAVKAAEKVVEKVVERPREQVDNGEMIRRAIGRRESMAVLIDADNAQLSKLKATMDELSKFGRIVVRKAYGDWKNPCLKNWETVLTDLAIKPEQQFAYTKGKNATDIALVIDAMDLLATGRYDTFAILSCDSDYTPLVMRLRETGAYVFGIGADKTPSAFVNACDVFINTRMFAEKKSSTPPTAALPDVIHPLTVIGLEDIFALMQTAADIHRDADGWTSVSDAGSYIKQVFPSFRVKSYGYAKMADLVLSHPERFETKTYAHRGATILAYRVTDEE